MEDVGVPISIGDVGPRMLGEPTQMGIFGDVVLELDDEGSLVHLSLHLGDGNEGLGRGTKDRCG